MAVAGGILVTGTGLSPTNSALLPMRFYFAVSSVVAGTSEIHAYPWDLLVQHYEILE